MLTSFIKKITCLTKNEYLFLALLFFSFPILYLLKDAETFLWLSYILGTVVFLFVPGFFISLCLIPKGKLDVAGRLLFSILFSFLIPPFVTYSLHKSLPLIFPINFSVAISVIFLISLIAFLLGRLINKKQIKLFEKDFSSRLNKKEAGVLLAIFLLTSACLCFFIADYQFLRTLDDSYYFSLSKSIIENESYPIFRPQVFPPFPEANPPIFQTSLSIWSILSLVDLKLIFRFGVPIVSTLVVIPLFLVVRESVSKKPNFLFVWALFFISIPVLFSQMLKARPQTIYFVVSMAVLYALTKYINNNSKSRLIWIFISLILIIISFKLHALSILLFPPFLFSLYRREKELIRSNFKMLILGALLLSLPLYKYLESYGVIKKITYLIEQIIRQYSGLNFLSGPFGITTYFANLSFVLIAVLVLTIILAYKNKIILNKLHFYPFFIYASIFIFFLEILPRLGFNFLSDRAFPHLALALIVLLAPSVKWLVDINKIYLRSIAYGLYIISIASVIYVSFLPTYYTLSNKEVDAVKFLNSKNDVLVFTQNANVPMIREFGNFMFVSKRDKNLKKLFNAGSSEKAYAISTRYINYGKSTQVILDEQRQYISSQISFLDEDTNSNSLESVRNNIDMRLNKIKKLVKEYDFIDKENFDVYILYSKIKDRSFFAKNNWWKDVNFSDSDISKFNDENYFEKVFENEDAIIWRPKKY